ncbi:MAG: hypothetical protein KBI47_01550 [Armatimonadetes bacterium]|nr:hypothetical protein [Armatimonadota bacterium]MDI9585318.1 hypothetical protein [Acidobacteriota bacterium]
MSWTVKVTYSLAVAAYVAALSAAQAAERLDVNGTLVGEGRPTGWAPNKPGYWDEDGTVALTPIADLEMNSVRLSSATRAMHLYYTRRFAAEEGDRILVSCIMRGEGAGSLGVYFYPAGGWMKREFSVSGDWGEYSVELALGAGTREISVVIGIPPCASAEFLDLTARISGKKEP